MRVYEINKQIIEIYGYEEDEFEKFLENGAIRAEINNN